MCQRDPTASVLLSWIADGKLRKERLSPNRIRWLATQGSSEAKTSVGKIYLHFCRSRSPRRIPTTTRSPGHPRNFTDDKPCLTRHFARGALAREALARGALTWRAAIRGAVARCDLARSAFTRRPRGRHRAGRSATGVAELSTARTRLARSHATAACVAELGSTILRLLHLADRPAVGSS